MSLVLTIILQVILLAVLSQQEYAPQFQHQPTPTITPSATPSATLAPSPTMEPSISISKPTPSPKAAVFPPLPVPDQPFGVVTITCDSITGFAFDPRNPDAPIRWLMDFKSTETDNKAFDGNGGYTGAADQPSPDVNAFYKLIGGHGINWKMDSFYKIGKPVTFTVSAYSNGSRPELVGSPKTLTCNP